MLTKTLSEVRKYVPTYWPLQSFIASNPLAGLTSKPFIECLQSLSHYIKINGALGIDLYHDYYNSGKISLGSLSYAVKEFMIDNHVFDEESHEVIVSQLLNPCTQIKLERQLKICSLDKSILISTSIEKNSNYLESNKVSIKISKFLADFFDLGQAKWKMPIVANDLYQTWVEYCSIENSFIKKVMAEIQGYNSEETILYLANSLGIPEDLLEQYLIEINFKIIGWSSIVKWIEERPDNPYINLAAKLTDIYVMWLSLEYALSLEYNIKFCTQNCQNLTNKDVIANIILDIPSDKNKLSSTIDRYSIHLIWQRALEKEYQNEILYKIKSATYNKKNTYLSNNLKSKAQFVFCIDTRSEGIRRKLEFIGEYDTFGFAGFFGVGFKLNDQENNNCSLQCPVIVSPEHILVNKKSKQRKLDILASSFSKVFKNVKDAFLSPLFLFDIIGLYYSFGLILKTIFPNKLNKFIKYKSTDKFSNKSIDIFSEPGGFTKDLIADKVSFVLKAIGLVNNFSQFVIITGHIAESENNPFQSSLDCGACGGNGGIPNAIAFCQALNDYQVREIIKAKHGITIPKQTFFISACHNTTTDKFSYYNLNELNITQQKIFNTIMDDINEACDLLRMERLSSLYGDKSVDMRKSNWAELVPEMGLANNAAIIIGPRNLTKNINLERRTFLHSYEPDLDNSGEILSFIFNAPVIVAHWINSQYYFSTTDKNIYGAGNKAIHNIIGEFGVMEGNFSDYKIGLPEQSIMYRQQLMHQPMRLTIFVYAKPEIIEKALEQSLQLKELIDGRWLYLECLEVNL